MYLLLRWLSGLHATVNQDISASISRSGQKCWSFLKISLTFEFRSPSGLRSFDASSSVEKLIFRQNPLN